MTLKPTKSGRTGDARRILAAHGLRAAAYGFSSILLGVSLEARGWQSGQVGIVLGAILVGTAALSFVAGSVGDRVGRRRFYALCSWACRSRVWPLGLPIGSGSFSS
jgi:MFS family permease